MNVVVDIVRKLKPGEQVSISQRLLANTTSYEHGGAIFTPVDQVLEKIVGSAYSYIYQIDDMNRTILFKRLEKPVELGQAYVSPDHRARLQKTGG